MKTLKLPKRWYTHKKIPKPISDEELLERLAMIPEDTRDFTGKVMGDPIEGDQRRLQCKNEESVNSADK